MDLRNESVEYPERSPADRPRTGTVRRSLHDIEVERIAAAFVGIWKSAVLDAIHRSGRLLLERVFGGDVDLFHKRGRKSASLQRVSTALAAQGLHVSVSQLRKTIHRHLVLRDVADALDADRVRTLKPSHLDEVVSLSRVRRVELLSACAHEQWTVVELRRRRTGAARRRAAASAGGRDSTAGRSDRATRLRLVLEEVRQHEERVARLFEELSGMGAIDRATRVELLGIAVRLRNRMENLEARLSRVLSR